MVTAEVGMTRVRSSEKVSAATVTRIRRLPSLATLTRFPPTFCRNMPQRKYLVVSLDAATTGSSR